MNAKEAKSLAEYLADAVTLPFTVLNLRKEPGFFSVYSAEHVNDKPGQFSKHWNVLYTIYPW